MYLLLPVKRQYWRLRRLIYGVPPNPRHHVHNYEIQPGAYLQVYSKEVKVAENGGLGCSLFVLGVEVLRLDCFGPYGHWHQYPKYRPVSKNAEGRMFFMEETSEEQIERSIFELKRNALYHVQRSPDPKAREFKLDVQRTCEEAARAREQLLYYARERRAAAAKAGNGANGAHAKQGAAEMDD